MMVANLNANITRVVVFLRDMYKMYKRLYKHELQLQYHLITQLLITLQRLYHSFESFERWTL